MASLWPTRSWVIARYRREYRRLVKHENLTPEAAQRFAAANVEWRTRGDAAVVHGWIQDYVDGRDR